MKITKNDGSKLYVKVRDYEPSIAIDYDLIYLSSGRTRSIDRGVDFYASKLIFSGRRSDMYNLVDVLQELRVNEKEVVLTELEEKYFGEHIVNTAPIKCVIQEISDVTSPKLNVYTLEVTFAATDLTLIPATGGQVFPTSIRCLSSGWKGYNEWNSQVLKTYKANNYFMDRSRDKVLFTGQYFMSNDDVGYLYRNWVSTRGNPFTIVDGSMGITDMFGPSFPGVNHTVVITRIDYEITSPGYKTVTVELIKVG